MREHCTINRQLSALPDVSEAVLDRQTNVDQGGDTARRNVHQHTSIQSISMSFQLLLATLLLLLCRAFAAEPNRTCDAASTSQVWSTDIQSQAEKALASDLSVLFVLDPK